MAPIPQLIVRTKDGVELFYLPSKGLRDGDGGRIPGTRGGLRLIEGESCPFHVLHPDGDSVLISRPSVGLVSVDLARLRAETLEDVASILATGLDATTETSLRAPLFGGSDVASACFSPRGAFVTTWERPVKAAEAGGAPPDNLRSRRSSDGAVVRSFFRRNAPERSRDGGQYDALQYTHDERLCGRLVTNELHVFDARDDDAAASPVVRVRCPGLTSFSFSSAESAAKRATSSSSSSSSYLGVSFVPESKGRPARVSLHRVTVTEKEDGSLSGSESVISSKSFYQTESVSVKWSPRGDSALVQTQTTVDTSGRSYYGSSTLFLFSESSDAARQVDLPTASATSGIKDNNPVVHDVAWCPNPAAPPRFAVISGNMPAAATLHNGVTGDAVFSFGNAHRNVVDWAPRGRFLCLAGFGNLAGGMDFWDKNRLAKIVRPDGADGEVRAHCAVGHGWSPDDRAYLVSTTSPRMNVDNGVRVRGYDGRGPLGPDDVPWDDADHAPDRLLAVDYVPAARATYPDRPATPPPSGRAKASSTSTSDAAPPAAPARYVPPSARRAGGDGGLADRLRREREGAVSGPGAIKPDANAAARGRVVVGAAPTPDPHAKSKSAQRRERQKLARERAKKEAEEAAAREAAAAAAAPVDPEKRAKKLKKTLKQIDELKTKRDAGADLNEDQIKKIDAEDALRAELEALGL